MSVLRTLAHAVCTSALLLALMAVLLPGTTQAERPHILWIVIDSWRWDHVDVYQTGVALMPHLARRAQRATVFWRAYATSSWTVPSVASLFTGIYPSFHRATMFGSTLPPHQTLAPSALSKAGYRTVAISANAFISKRSSFAQGFTEFLDAQALLSQGRKGKVRGTTVVKTLDEWLNKQQDVRSSPLFLYLHFMDPHWPYGPEEQFLSQVLPRFGEASELKRLIGELYFGQLRLEGNTSTELQNALRALYAGEVLATDAALEELFVLLERHRLAENALIVLTADHGEELFDRGHLGHGRTLFEEVVRVPLLVWFPGQKKRIDIHHVVSHTDVLPTSLDVAGITSPLIGAEYRGRSLVACGPTTSWATRLQRWVGRKKCGDSSRLIWLELLPMKELHSTAPLHRAAVIRDMQKLLVLHDGSIQRVDLASDPREQHIAPLHDRRFENLEAAWDDFRERLTSEPPPPVMTPDAATREHLRVLGYGD